MIIAPIPEDEHERLDTLRQYEVLDTGAEANFDDIIELAAQLCQAPIALVSLVDKDRQWFKAKLGLNAEETHRDLAFCAHAILADDILIVENALLDPRFKANPLVQGEPHIRFYAGAPLITPSGHKLGTLCIIDTEPRTLNQIQLKAIKTLSKHTVHLLELRKMYGESIRLNQELLEKNVAIKEMSQHNQRFLANINHEMRTPLNAISGFSTQLLKRITKLELPAFVEEGLESIQLASKHLNNLINDVLDLSKLNANKLNYNAAPFDPHTLLQEVLYINSVEAEKHQVELVLDVDSHLPDSLLGDEQKIAQVLINIVANAIKFTPQGKSVTIQAKTKELTLEIRVVDQGVGIDKHDLKKIFQEFEQVTNPLSHRTKGTGLGLPIAHQLVKLMGGSIKVDSKLGKGTEFVIEIPTQDFQSIAPFL